MLSFQIDAQLTTALRELAQECARRHELVQALSPEELDFIHRNVRISSIGASTRIENAVLTDAEVDWLDTTLSQDARTTSFLNQRNLIQNKLSKDKERSIEEVVGCRAMLHLVYEQGQELFPLTEATICGLHRELLKHYPAAEHYHGQYKKVTNSVVRRNEATGEQVPVLITAPPGSLTVSTMNGLVEWYNQTLPQHPWTLAVACEFVFRFLAIHPFQDGNGRLGRALFILALLQGADKSVCAMTRYLAIDRHIEQRREEYYLVLRKCSGGKFSSDATAYEFSHFLRFMLKVTQEALNDFDLYRERFKRLNTLSLATHTVLKCFREQPEIRLQTRFIVEHTGLARRTIGDALVALIDAGFLQKYGRGKGTYYQLIF